MRCPNRTDLRRVTQNHLAHSAAPDLAAGPDDRPRPEVPSNPPHRLPPSPPGVGVLAGAAITCSRSPAATPVEQWVPDFNGDGQIDQSEINHQQAKIAQAVEGQRRAVQAHPFLSCVRAHESGGNYAAQNPRSTASGAYQFLDSTWRNVSARSGHPGYARAAHAPWHVQDAVALWLYNNGGRSAWRGTGC